jgi:hypothetical protein
MSTNDIGLGPLGFSEEAQSITREVNRHMHGVTDRVRKGRAVLKMLKFWLNEHHSRQGVTDQDLSDVEDLVDMALDELPHHYEDINDPVDEMIGQAGSAIKAAQRWQERTETVLEALTVATWPDVSVGELSRQAQRLAAVADADDRLVEAWEAFKRLLEPHGLKVAVERSDDGAISGVSVLDADAQKEYPRLRRACATHKAAMRRFAQTLEASHAE